MSPGHARTIQIFVSSPGDVSNERNALPEVIERINDTDGKKEGYRLELFRWERNVARRLGDEPQNVIDEQTGAYEIYLGIIATRVGEGTKKEFEAAQARHEAEGRPWVSVFFRENVVPGSDPDAAMAYTGVCVFRQELEKLGLVNTYDGEAAFAGDVEQHLRNVLRELLTSGDGSTPPPQITPTGTPVVPPAYRSWRRDKSADIDLLGLNLKEARPVHLNHVYVPLTTTAARDEPETEPDAEHAIGRPDHALLLDAVDEASLLVTGASGSGKSTFCRWVAWLALASEMPANPVECPDDFVEHFPEKLAGRLPLIVPLRDCWRFLPESGDRRTLSRADLETALRAWLDDAKPGGLEWPIVAAHVANGTALLIFDGVDEVPPSRGEVPGAWCPRGQLLSGLAAALPEWEEAGNRILVTSRPYGVDESDVRRLGLRHAPISDLPGPLGQLLVRRWFRILENSPAAADAAAEQLERDMSARAELAPLRANPLLLTAVCVVYRDGKKLPQDKYELYVRIVDGILHKRYEKDRTLIDTVRNRLAVIAHAMHTGGEGLEDPRPTPRAEVGLDEIDRVLAVYRKKYPSIESDFADNVAAREDLLSNSGLLLPSAGGRAGFYHLSLQEFLAAQRLLSIRPDDLRGVFTEHGAEEGWRNTLTFLYGGFAARSLEGGMQLLADLVERLEPTQYTLGVVLADCIQILQGRGVAVPEDVRERMTEFCLDAIDNEAPLRPRAELGLALGRLGDPRIVPDLQDESAYVRVEAGDYVIGDDRKKVTIAEPFLLGRYPVTNGQFRPFVEKGYRERQWWSEEGLRWLKNLPVREPRFWHEQRLNGDSQPVVGISYWEAEAFAAWAGGRLPTEVEWEAAVRGAEGREYPWSGGWQDEICNSHEADLGLPTPVGLFPRSRSAGLGLEDMAGNVWEWCQPDQRAGSASDDVRVLRGGSCFNNSRVVRCACRSMGHPVYRLDNIGFRVLCGVGVRTRNG